MSFWRSSPAAKPSGTPLEILVQKHMPEADDDTLGLVVAITGLLACVAYADRKYDDAEQAHVREALAAVHVLAADGVDAICAVLRDSIAIIAAGNTQQYTRNLRDSADLELRREVLDVLVDLAAVDGELALAETDLLRRAASAMALTPEDYLASQTRHRDKLRSLR